MTDLIKYTLLERISQLQRFIRWTEATATDATGAELLEHLRQELAVEQSNLRLAQYRSDIWEGNVDAGREGMLYDVILADPPWQFRVWNKDTGQGRSAESHYPTMTLEDICALNIPSADNAVLFLWVTFPR